MTHLRYGPALMARLDELASVSDDPQRLTRLYLSSSHAQAMQKVAGWMEEAGMTVHPDAVANVVGRYDGQRPDAPVLLLGSHIDTVVDGGKFDGSLGVLAAIAAVDALHKEGVRLPPAVEVVAFGDEEGVRFPGTLTGSRALAGTLEGSALEVCDEAGVSMRDALVNIGCDPSAFGSCARRPDKVLGYVELHIEQGPVLEAEGLPMGVVTAINGSTRLLVEVRGQAGHAGTVPMELRRDALAGAAQMVLAVEREGHASEEVVATVGKLETHPGAANVIPGMVRFTVDVRAPDDDTRRNAVGEIEQAVRVIAERRHLEVMIDRFHDAPAAVCDAGLVGRLAVAVGKAGMTPRLLPSGAGHDAMALASLCPIGMLFVRCKGGISHNPAESITVEDADAAVRALIEVLRSFR